MIGHIKVRERGATPGILAKEWRGASKTAWGVTGTDFHRAMLPRRFTHEGARELQYAPRAGENLRGTKGYWRSYTGRKERRFRHRLPLVYTGETRQLARIRDVRATSNGVKIVLNARKLNFRNPKSKIRMNEEIRRVSPRETVQLAKWHDAHLNVAVNAIKAEKTRNL